MPFAPGRPANGTQWDGERRTHIDPDSHAAWAFNNRRDGGSRHYQMFDPSWSTETHGWIQSQKMSDMLIDGRCKTERAEGPCQGCTQCSRLFCTQCKHDTSSQFSLGKGGSGAYKKSLVLDHCQKKHPEQTQTRNLAAMFVDTMQKEKTRVMSLIKLALLLASEALPSTKFPALCSLLWHLNILDASGQRYSLGNGYTHRNAAKDFVAALASVLRDRINVAARASRVLGLMLDESTDQSGKKVLLTEDKWWDGTLVSRAGKKHKQFPLHYVVKYPDGREAYSPLPCASYGVDGEWLIIVKSRVKK